MSPEGEWVGFVDETDYTLKKVSVFGGPPVTICGVGGGLHGASWGTDDAIIFATSAGSGLWRVSAHGGDPEELTTLDPAKGETNHGWPEILPSGNAVLFTILTGDIGTAQIAVFDLSSQEQKVLVSRGSSPRYASTGHVVYGTGSTLRAMGFDPVRLEVTTNPIPVLTGVVTKSSGGANFSLADNGSLVYMPALRPERTLVWVDRDGREEPVGADPLPYDNPRVCRLTGPESPSRSMIRKTQICMFTISSAAL